MKDETKVTSDGLTKGESRAFICMSRLFRKGKLPQADHGVYYALRERVRATMPKETQPHYMQALETIHSLTRERDALRAQRDALVAALSDLIERAEGREDFDVSSARAALAAARGRVVSYYYTCKCGAERASESLWVEQDWACPECRRRGCYVRSHDEPAEEDGFARYHRAADALCRATDRIAAVTRGGRQDDCGCVIIGACVVAPCEGHYQLGQVIREGEALRAAEHERATGEPKPGVRWTGD